MFFTEADSAVSFLAAQLGALKQHSASFKESWDEAVVIGSGSKIAYQLVLSITEQSKKYEYSPPAVDLGESAATEEEFRARLEANDFIENWRIILSKNVCGDNGTGPKKIGFFTSQDSFLEWLTNLNPFLPTCPICQYSELVIVVSGLEGAFSTPTATIRGLGESISPAQEQSTPMPGNHIIRETLHVLCSDDVVFFPRHFLPVSGHFESAAGRIFLNKSEAVLAACLASTFGQESHISLKGIKHHSLSLASRGNPETPPSEVVQLGRLVSWAYLENRDTRLKLVRDRLSLDLDPSRPFAPQCSSLADDILAQCRDEYDYVVSDLRNEFEAGKRQFLTDLKSLAMGYHDRMHDMLKALIRDFLAVLLFLTLGVGAKLIDSPMLALSHPFALLMKALGFYVLASGVLQSFLYLFDYRDLSRLAGIWARHTRGFMNEDRVEHYIDEYTRTPRRWFSAVLAAWFAAYIALGTSLFNADISSWLTPKTDPPAKEQVSVPTQSNTPETKIMDDQSLIKPSQPLPTNHPVAEHNSKSTR